MSQVSCSGKENWVIDKLLLPVWLFSPPAIITIKARVYSQCLRGCYTPHSLGRNIKEGCWYSWFSGKHYSEIHYIAQWQAMLLVREGECDNTSKTNKTNIYCVSVAGNDRKWREALKWINFDCLHWFNGHDCFQYLLNSAQWYYSLG